MNFLFMFYEELNLKDEGVSKTQIDETRQLLNIFMSSIPSG